MKTTHQWKRKFPRSKGREKWADRRSGRVGVEAGCPPRAGGAQDAIFPSVLIKIITFITFKIIRYLIRYITSGCLSKLSIHTHTLCPNTSIYVRTYIHTIFCPNSTYTPMIAQCSRVPHTLMSASRSSDPQSASTQDRALLQINTSQSEIDKTVLLRLEIYEKRLYLVLSGHDEIKVLPATRALVV